MLRVESTGVVNYTPLESEPMSAGSDFINFIVSIKIATIDINTVAASRCIQRAAVVYKTIASMVK